MALKDFIDEKGFIGHGAGDGTLEFGDSAQRTFTKEIADFLLYPEKRADLSEDWQRKVYLIWRLIGPRMQFVRHWDSRAWPGQLWTMSRDNLWALMISMALHGEYLDTTLSALWRRFGLTWNYKTIWPKEDDEPKIPDWITPTTLAMFWLRGLGPAWAIPALWILDLEQLLGILILIIKSWFKPMECSDDLNAQLTMVWATQQRFSPPLWFAKKLYASFRRDPWGGQYPPGIEKGDHIAKKVFRFYYLKGWANPPPMWEFYDEIVERMF